MKLAVQISSLCGWLRQFVLQRLPWAWNRAQVSKEAQVNPALGATCIKYVRSVLPLSFFTTGIFQNPMWGYGVSVLHHAWVQNCLCSLECLHSKKMSTHIGVSSKQHQQGPGRCPQSIASCELGNGDRWGKRHIILASADLFKCWFLSSCGFFCSYT